MINKDFKIILFNGGFAGDLLTALYNPDVFKGFNKNTIVLVKEAMSLKEDLRDSSYDKKIECLESIKDLGVCSSHGLELGLRLKDNTILVHCSDYELAKFFHSRFNHEKHTQLSLDQHTNWQRNSRQVYKKQIDLADLNKPYFLEDLKITDSRSTNILTQWLELNKYE